MNSWILFVALILGVMVLLYFTKRKEGYADFTQTYTGFLNHQDKYFQDQAGKEIYVNPGLDYSDFSSALFQPDMNLANTKDRDFNTYLRPNPYHALVDFDSMCRKAKQPRNLPARTPRDIAGCGWWYMPDTPSVGAYGTLQGPKLPEKLPGGGQWVWEIPVAQQMEEIKFCKRIKTCDLIEVPGVKGVCGFCTRLGYAVPIKADGTDKYPDSQTGACGARTKMTAEACRPPPPPVVTSDGIDCKNLGRASPDNSIRLYGQGECSQLDGNWYSNGECLIKGGGSYSAACSVLNSALLTQSPRTCDPGPSGALSRECLISLASGIGFTKTGAVLAMLYTSSKPTALDQQAISEMASLGITIPDSVLGSGMIDSQGAAETYSKIYDAMTSGKTGRTREAAKYLVMGSDNFDPCSFDAKTTGPFNVSCLQQSFREAGCQASGAAYPSTANANKYNGMTWGDVGSMFKGLYAKMNSPAVADQDSATKDCIGVSFYRPPIPKTPTKYDGYDLHLQKDHSNGNDIACYFDGRDASDCKARCDADPNCKSFNDIKTPGTSGCCYKRGGSVPKPFPASAGNVNLYVKKPKNYSGYTLTANSDRGGADIVCHTDGRNADSCKAECDNNPGCQGFNDVDYIGWPGKKGCCVKTSQTPVTPFDKNVGDVHFYAKQKLTPNTVCGVNSGDGIYCADQNIDSSPNWSQLPGSLKNVSVSNGKVAGANSIDGIWSADNYRSPAWVNAWGALVQVSQDKGIVVGVNKQDNIYYADNGNKSQPNWTQLPGALINVCITNGVLYGCNRGNNIYYAANYKNPQWIQIPGSLKQISADKSVVCGVNSGNQIWCYDNGNPSSPNWFNVPGSLIWVAVRNGTLYGANSNNDIYYNPDYRSANWRQIPGKLKQVDLDRG